MTFPENSGSHLSLVMHLESNTKLTVKQQLQSKGEDTEAAVIHENTNVQEEECGTWWSDETFKTTFPKAPALTPKEITYIIKNGKRCRGVVREPDMGCKIGCVRLKNLVGVRAIKTNKLGNISTGFVSGSTKNVFEAASSLLRINSSALAKRSGTDGGERRRQRWRTNEKAQNIFIAGP